MVSQSLLERIVRRIVRRPAAAPSGAQQDLKRAYIEHVEGVKTRYSTREQAMEEAVGGLFDQIGAIEAGLVRHYGLPADGYLIDVGCGSGRLAKPLSAYLNGRYLGTDLVPELIQHAKHTVPRLDWRFEVIDHIEIPEAHHQADMVCFFSVMTHLLHEQSYWYLEEARRVLKPGGKILFSFLEFHDARHWPIFRDMIAGAKGKTHTHLNVFMDGSWFESWASSLQMVLEDVRGGTDEIVSDGFLGQALCVLRKPE